jgi:hypothetical protein
MTPTRHTLDSHGFFLTVCAVLIFSFRKVLVLVGGLMLLVAITSWFPVEGEVFIDAGQSARLKTLLADQKPSWETKSVLGGEVFTFRNPFFLMSIEDRIEKDALSNGYSVSIEYKTLWPHYRRVRNINDFGPAFR